MHDVIVWRTVWKEYRQQRGFWLAIFAGGVLIQMLALVVTVLSPEPPTPYTFFAVALSMPVLYALGSGAQLFAGEHDAETYEFQRALPVRWRQLAIGKLSFSFASSVALLLVLWGSALLFARGWLPPALEHGLLWYGGAVALLEALAWSVFLSLILRRVLVVVLLTPLAMLASFIAIQIALEPWLRSEDAFVMTLPFRFVPALAVLALDLWLARRWLNERRWPSWRGWRGGARNGDAASSAFARLPPRTSSLGLLVWHEWRQSRGTIAAIWAVILALAAILVTRGVGWRSLSDPLIRDVWIMLATGVLPLVGVVSGACVFLGDQRRCRFRFFADHGISPRRVWLSRHLVWLAMPGIWILLLAAGLVTSHAVHKPFLVLSRITPADVFQWLGLVLSLYCVAQASPLFVRSVAIGFFGSLLSCMLFGFWGGLMTSCRVPIWFSIAPIPICLLLATWLRAPDWILEKTSWRARLRAVTSIVGPLAAVGIAVICYRVFEVPQVKLSFDPATYRRPPSAEEVRTAEMYFEASILPAGWPAMEAWIAEAANEQERQARRKTADEARQDRNRAVARFLEASRRADCWFPSRWDASLSSSANSSELGGTTGFPLLQLQAAGASANPWQSAVLESAQALEDAGKLDEAWERYLAVMRFARHLQRQADLMYQDAGDRAEADACARIARWAARPGHTPERLRSARKLLEREFFASPPPREGVLIGAYLEARAGFGFDGMALDVWRGPDAGYHRKARWVIPWEYARIGRLLDLYVNTELQRLHTVETALAQGRSARDVDRHVLPEPVASLLPTTPLIQPALSGSAFDVARPDRRPVSDALVAQAVRHRVLRLQLALLTWRLKHGRLPESLEQMVGSELDKVPVDPFSGGVFLYRPQGVDLPLIAADTTSLCVRPSREKAAAIEPQAAILWSSGPELAVPRPARSTDAWDPNWVFHWPWMSQEPLRRPVGNAWSHGWAFPIP